MKKYRSLAGMILGFLLLAWMSKTCYAEIADVTAFENLEWKKVHEEALIAPQGVVQSICATKNYIICIENTNDAQDTPDTVSAYYKNDTDADGNPVEQYSLALRNTDNNWEHGNGMAYNQAKEEIYVAPYTSQNPENRGCLFVMDANTLAYKGKIKISDDYNILGIGYREETDQYVIQTNVEGGYSFKILDNQFQIAEDLGRYEGTSVGTNFQDLQLVDEYILNFPLTLNMGIGDYLNVYSLETKELVSCSKLNFPFEGVSNDEPEGLCETAEGTYIAVVDEDRIDGRRMFCFYETQVPCKEEAVSAEENIDTNENDVGESNRQTKADTLGERTDSEKNTDLEENTDSEEIPTSSEDYKKEASKSLKKQSAKNTPKEVSFAEKMSIGFSGMITQAQELSKKLPSVVELAKEAGNLAGTFIETLLTKIKTLWKSGSTILAQNQREVFLFLAIGFTIISIMGLWVCIVQLIRIRKQKKARAELERLRKAWKEEAEQWLQAERKRL